MIETSQSLNVSIVLSVSSLYRHISKAPIRPSGHIRDTRLGVMGVVLETISWVVIVITFPLSMLFCFKVIRNNVYIYIYICCEQVVTEYERAVVFKLGRLKKGGSLGPGLHFELPCIGASR